MPSSEGYAAGGSAAALLLADARLPVGGHTQSGGLESALLSGLAPGDVPGFIEVRLRTVGCVEAGTAVLARRVVVDGVDLAPLQAAWAARTPSEVARAASAEAARGWLRLLRRWTDDDPGGAAALAAVTALGRGVGRPLVVGALAGHLRLTAAQTARVVLVEDVQTVTSAALKLFPLDPLDAATWALAALPLLDAIVARVAGLTDPDDLPAPTAPRLERWQHDVPRHDRRLFRA